MSKLNGNLILIEFEGYTLACQTSGNFNVDSDMLDTTCKGEAPNRTFIPGLQNATISLEGFYDPDATTGTGALDLIGYIKDGQQVTWKFGQLTSGDIYLTGEGYLSNVSIDGPLNDVASYSATLQVTGAWSQVQLT